MRTMLTERPQPRRYWCGVCGGEMEPTARQYESHFVVLIWRCERCGFQLADDREKLEPAPLPTAPWTEPE